MYIYSKEDISNQTGSLEFKKIAYSNGTLSMIWLHAGSMFIYYAQYNSDSEADWEHANEKHIVIWSKKDWYKTYRRLQQKTDLVI